MSIVCTNKTVRCTLCSTILYVNKYILMQICLLRNGTYKHLLSSMITKLKNRLFEAQKEVNFRKKTITCLSEPPFPPF